MAKISILMGIYNCAATLPAAIDCILAQTVTDWVLILCDDGSSDHTYGIAKKYGDRYPDKIILLQNEKNMGLPYCLNRGIEIAKGTYIARMDGDDISFPKRFEKQLQYIQLYLPF